MYKLKQIIKHKNTCKNARIMADEASKMRLCSIHSSPAWTQPISWMSLDRSSVSFDIFKKKKNVGQAKQNKKPLNIIVNKI